MTNPTYPLVKFGITDVVIKNAISLIYRSEGTPLYTNFNDLITGVGTKKPYATYEPDYWLLDGSFKFIPPFPHIGYISEALTNSSKNWSGTGSSANMIIDFSSPQDMTSFGLHFDEAGGLDWCTSVQVQFLDASFSVLYITTVSPTSTSYVITHNVSGVSHMYVYLLATNKAFRRTRLTGIDFNGVTYLNSEKIKEAIITEEYSPISENITSNAFELDLLLDSSEFSIVNPSSSYANLPENMPFSVYEVIDNVSVFMGLFYLDTWENISEREVRFNCLDAIGLTTKLPFYGLAAVFQVPPHYLSWYLNYIFLYSELMYTSDSGVSTYQLGNDCNSYLVPSSLHDALQCLAMAFRLGITTWRTGKINFAIRALPVHTLDGNQDYTILLSSEKIDQVKLLPIISGVKIVRDGLIIYGGDDVVVFSKTLSAGDYIVSAIIDKQPSGRYVSISGATVTWPTDWGNTAWWNIPIHVSSPGLVKITATHLLPMPVPVPDEFFQGHFETNLVVNSSVKSASVIEINTTMASHRGTFSDGDTDDQDLGQAQWIADYYGQRYYQKSTVYGIVVHAGDLVKIASLDSKYIMANIESAVIQLVGLRTEVEVVGVLL